MNKVAGRPFDIVVYGATGFAGRQCALYLATSYPLSASVRWAIAGRSLAKLEQLKSSLVNIDASMSHLTLIQADTEDYQTLTDMCGQTKVVLSTVGPYAQFGEPMVKAAIESGTHYCDLTGETPFIRDMASKYHQQAQANGVKIVNCCGFDCVPSDMGTQMIVNKLKEKGYDVTECKTFSAKVKGGVSGGTIASAAGVVESSTFEQLAKLRDPYCISEQGLPREPYTNDIFVQYDQDVQRWVCSYVMAAINVPLVQRSASLVGYGTAFKYYERTICKSMFSATLMASSLALLSLLLLFPPFRWLLKSLIKQGTGPSDHEMDTGFFHMVLYGKGSDSSGGQGCVEGSVSCYGADPGYKGTARMIVESGLSLALEADKTPDRAGVLTPASAIGPILIQRLSDKAGFSFSAKFVN